MSGSQLGDGLTIEIVTEGGPEARPSITALASSTAATASAVKTMSVTQALTSGRLTPLPPWDVCLPAPTLAHDAIAVKSVKQVAVILS